MHLAANIFDVWVFRRRGAETEFLLLHTSVEKATRYFNDGRFWQIPSNSVNDGESITEAIVRVLDGYGPCTSTSRGSMSRPESFASM